jgi:starvation-inducible DNA-binding protein
MTAILESSATLFRSSMGIPVETRGQIVERLNLRLCDALDLKLQAKHAHWNVKGMEFLALHQLFNDIASHCEEQSDLIAERVTALGGVAKGLARFVVENSSVPTYGLDAVLGEQHIRVLTKGIAGFGARVRADIELAEKLGDKASADLLTEVLRQVDKDLWLVEAHLQA